MKIRLNKFIAESGICSRRQADELIRQGKVKLNGRVAKEMGARIEVGRDRVEVEGERTGDMTDRSDGSDRIYIMINKPVGYVCTTRKFKGEKNVLDLVDTRKRIYPVGRLDKESEGLLILTNDGGLANKLTHPKFEHEKEYEVSLEKDFNKNDLVLIKKGVEEKGELLPVKKIKIINSKKLNIVLTQGKKRHIRRIFSKLGYNVSTLRRVRIGDLLLGDLKSGKWKLIEREEIL